MKKILLIFYCLLLLGLDQLFAFEISNISDSAKVKYEYDKDGNIIKTEFFSDDGIITHEIIDNGYYSYYDFGQFSYDDLDRYYNIKISRQSILIPDRTRDYIYVEQQDEVPVVLMNIAQERFLDFTNYLNRKINEETPDKNDDFTRKVMNYERIEKIEIFYENEKLIHLIYFFKGNLKGIRAEAFLENNSIVCEK